MTNHEESRRRVWLRRSLWLDALLVAVNAYSLIRESVEQWWPLWRVVGHSAVLVAFAVLFALTVRALHRPTGPGRPGGPGGTDPAGRVRPARHRRPPRQHPAAHVRLRHGH